jgi:hypothetical protein
MKNQIHTNNGQQYLRLINPSTGKYDRDVTRKQIGDAISSFSPLAETSTLAGNVAAAFQTGDADAAAAVWYGVMHGQA